MIFVRATASAALNKSAELPQESAEADKLGNFRVNESQSCSTSSHVNTSSSGSFDIQGTSDAIHNAIQQQLQHRQTLQGRTVPVQEPLNLQLLQKQTALVSTTTPVVSTNLFDNTNVPVAFTPDRNHWNEALGNFSVLASPSLLSPVVNKPISILPRVVASAPAAVSSFVFENNHISESKKFTAVSSSSTSTGLSTNMSQERVEPVATAASGKTAATAAATATFGKTAVADVAVADITKKCEAISVHSSPVSLPQQPTRSLNDLTKVIKSRKEKKPRKKNKKRKKNAEVEVKQQCQPTTRSTYKKATVSRQINVDFPSITAVSSITKTLKHHRNGMNTALDSEYAEKFLNVLDKFSHMIEFW